MNDRIERCCECEAATERAERDALKAIVDQLPTTADGVRVVPDMDLWSLDSANRPYWLKYGVVSYKTFGDYSGRYSTKVAAMLAASTKDTGVENE